MGELLDAHTAAERLGVDVRTLYAYVSRGALRRVPGPDGRSSRYDSDDLELLAQRSRPRTLPRPAASIDLVIATRVSTVADGVVRYRGKDVLDLAAAQEPFERVADLLWRDSGEWPPAAWDCGCRDAPALAPGDSVPVLRRFAVLIATLPDTTGLPVAQGTMESALTATPDWASHGRRLITCLAGTDGTTGRGPAGDAMRIAGRLWRRWSPLPPSEARIGALNTALVLLAEHELALSTLSVRVAASARATPGACILAGLSTLSGDLHGGAGRVLHELLLCRAAKDSAAKDSAAEGTAGTAGGGPVPPPAVGFCHPVHVHGDPRAAPLLDAVDAFATDADRDLIGRVRRAAPGKPTVDFALAALTYAARMPPEAATAIFATARIAGWIAHAAEEFAEPPLRFRGRAFRRPAARQ